MNGKDSRLRYLDLAKGLDMAAVMWGHITLNHWTNHLVYAFMLPAFFFLSGMVFQRERYGTLKEYLLRRIKRLLLPYAFWSVLTWAWWVLDLRIRGVEAPAKGIWYPLFQTVLSQGSGGYMIHNVAIWFVPCLFLVGLIYWFLADRPAWVVLTASAVFWVLGRLMLRPNPVMDFTELPWSLDVAICALPYYALGNLVTRRADPARLREFILEKKALSWLLWAVSFIILLIGSFYNGHTSMAQGIYGKSYIVYTVSAAAGVISLIVFSALADGMSGNTLDRCAGATAWFGQHSFDALMIHVPIMLVAARFATRNSGMDFYEAREHIRYTLPGFCLMLLMTVALIFLIDTVRHLWRKRRNTGR